MADHAPLSVLQQGMWFLEQIRPYNPAYVVPGAVRVVGAIDPPTLERAVNGVVARHEALRTTFGSHHNRPIQSVRPHTHVPLSVHDLRGDGFDQEDLRERVSREALGTPMDITTGPLLRTSLLRTGDTEWVLVLAMHHLVSDRWSVGVLLSETSRIYEALLRDETSDLPELSVQYGDFASWQRELAECGYWEQGTDYWREHLAGAPASLDLPTDRPRPAVQGFRGDIVEFELSPELVRGIGDLAREHGATRFMVMLAAFNVLMYRCSGQDDVVVGVPTVVRERAELEELVGYFVNTLPVRTDLSGAPDFVELLARVRRSALGAYDHHDVPFDLVVAGLDHERDLSRPPVYQVAFSHGGLPVPPTSLGGARLEHMWVAGRGAKFDLELQVFESGDQVSGWFEYDRDLFDRGTVERMVTRMRTLLESAIQDPRRPIDRLDLLDANERHRIMTEFNDTRLERPGDLSPVHEHFEEQVRRTPEAEAVRFEGASLSYAELNTKANRLAHRLVGAGVGRDIPVGVLLERSTDLVVSLMAVMKAGAAYLPLDPDLPRVRLEHMLSEAAVPVLLTTRAVAPDPLPPVATVLCPDDPSNGVDTEPGHDPGVAVRADDLAYVIYTSGSTGRPKGVGNVHGAILNRLLWAQETFALGAHDRVLQKTPFSFDVSVWEFFWPLMVGATLVVAAPGGHRDPAYLSRVIKEEGITTVHFVPSMLQVFLHEAVEECTDLRRVLCSGEALPPDLRDRFMERSGAELHNLYGPTEAAVDVTHWRCRPDDGPRVPIGRPIANTRLYVLDRHGEPAPIGVTGELHITGANLARGYLAQPELTAERFVPDPFDPVPGARLYRTGDLARFRQDGALEFLGRLDHQVKIRGFRVETGEIEHALTTHPGVREAVVTAHEYRPGDLRLVAYLTGDRGLDRSALAAHLSDRLPDYMVPTHFEPLDALPLNTNGKVDRSALPAPTPIVPDERTTQAPETVTEEEVARLWHRVLGRDRIGRDENFFDLGGNSLLMAETRAALAERTGRWVPMVDLFRYPTVRSLALHLDDSSPTPPPGTARERAELRRGSQNRRRRTTGDRPSAHDGR